MSEFKKMASQLGKEAKSFVWRYGGAAAIGVIATTMVYSNDENRQEQAMEAVRDNFMAKDECLDDTAYDVSNGAVIDFIETDKTDVVRIMPKDANAHRISVLFITEVDNGWYGFGDNKTAAFLVKQGCDGIPSDF